MSLRNPFSFNDDHIDPPSDTRDDESERLSSVVDSEEHQSLPTPKINPAFKELQRPTLFAPPSSQPVPAIVETYYYMVGNPILVRRPLEASNSPNANNPPPTFDSLIRQDVTPDEIKNAFPTLGEQELYPDIEHAYHRAKATSKGANFYSDPTFSQAAVYKVRCVITPEDKKRNGEETVQTVGGHTTMKISYYRDIKINRILAIEGHLKIQIEHHGDRRTYTYDPVTMPIDSKKKQEIDKLEADLAAAKIAATKKKIENESDKCLIM